MHKETRFNCNTIEISLSRWSVKSWTTLSRVLSFRTINQTIVLPYLSKQEPCHNILTTTRRDSRLSTSPFNTPRQGAHSNTSSLQSIHGQQNGTQFEVHTRLPQCHSPSESMICK